ncbi:MAG: type II toxin-antitoxin system Phd/YefM family antitoxin [Deltaproteobacteria bacterium]|nr:type II toxin-antitoxin system Phd/YefM family antitoxin [Deltaproteobacteria bacterium]
MVKNRMQQIPVSKFKATCLAVLEKVRRTGEPVVITRFNEVIAEVIPPRRQRNANNWLGSMRESGRVLGDLVEPVVDESDWEVF